MREIIMRGWDSKQFRVRVNLPSPIRQVQVPIRRVITPIRGLVNLIRQLVLLIAQVRSDPPYRSHLHPPSLSFSSTTLPSLQEHKDKLSIAISPRHHPDLTPIAAYADCSTHKV